MRYKIGLDVSGGDKAPDEILKGAILAKEELHEEVVLVGVKEEIEASLKNLGQDLSNFSIVHAPEKIDMAEPPATSVRKKRNSSITIGINLLKENKIDAFVSCGNTGAVVCASTLKLGLIEGVERPGIALAMPTKKGLSLIIDVGANIDCKVSHLFQYGIMASVYYKLVLGKENPSIGLLNIGEEASKGLGLIKDVHKLFSVSPLNFSGNLEAKDIFSGVCDCIVCDGFIGNIALKVIEGSVDIMGKFLIEIMNQGFLGKLSLLLARNNLRRFKRIMDYAEYGGAPLLGVDGIVIIGHGRSNSLAVKNAIKVAIQELSHDLNINIKRKINEICQDSGVREILTS